MSPLSMKEVHLPSAGLDVILNESGSLIRISSCACTYCAEHSFSPSHYSVTRSCVYLALHYSTLVLSLPPCERKQTPVDFHTRYLFDGGTDEQATSNQQVYSSWASSRKTHILGTSVRNTINQGSNMEGDSKRRGSGVSITLNPGTVPPIIKRKTTIGNNH